MNWEIGIDMYTLMCIKWMTNKNLLYKKINKRKFKIKKKKKAYTDIWPSNHTAGNFSQRNEYSCLHKNVFRDVSRNFICNS